MKHVRRVPDAVVAGYRGRVVFAGPRSEWERQEWQIQPGTVELDACGRGVVPGLVDPHNHLPFAGTREDEFHQKLLGVSYQEIAAKGGGIKGTVRKTREVTEQELTETCRWRLDQMLLTGTTCTEAKSGYGLNRDAEMRQLRVIAGLSDHPVRLVPTFMGAHDVPAEFSGNPQGFLDHLQKDILPEVWESGLARFADIFCEEGYFSIPQSEGYLRAAARLGYGLKLHGDEFVSNGAGFLAARVKATSIEHLIAVTQEEIGALADCDTVSVLLPGVSFFLRMNRYAPARSLLDAGALVALGTDFNPGSSMLSSQLMVFHLGIYQLGMTIEEAFNAVTINAAKAIGMEQELGSLDPGKSLDCLLLDAPDLNYVAYHLGYRAVDTVVSGGRVVVRGGRLIPEG